MTSSPFHQDPALKGAAPSPYCPSREQACKSQVQTELREVQQPTPLSLGSRSPGRWVWIFLRVRCNLAGPTAGVLAKRAQRGIWSMDRLSIASTQGPALCTEGFHKGLVSKVRISPGAHWALTGMRALIWRTYTHHRIQQLETPKFQYPGYVTAPVQMS